MKSKRKMKDDDFKMWANETQRLLHERYHKHSSVLLFLKMLIGMLIFFCSIALAIAFPKIFLIILVILAVAFIITLVVFASLVVVFICMLIAIRSLIL